jgi:N-acetylglucosaminyldiphosphoundecaprenol N-acetyl-beta-D-mannosaminyltransferase
MDTGDHDREADMAFNGTGASAATAVPRRARLAGFEFDLLTEAEVIHHIVSESRAGRGGWVATPNVDICQRVRRNPALRDLVSGATLVVPDGMPLLWAARLRGDPLAERVTGSSLIFSLTSAAASARRSVYLLGGGSGVPDLAGTELARRYPGLRVAGAYAPPVGFEESPGAVALIRERLGQARPDIVYVGLGFPKQERLIAELTAALPGAWFIGCGAAIPFAAGTLPRAPVWMQRAGLEWAFRLLKEPRRLFRRYLVDDAPYAAYLLFSSVMERVRTRHPGTPE